eukprot:CFRG2318T1
MSKGAAIEDDAFKFEMETLVAEQMREVDNVVEQHTSEMISIILCEKKRNINDYSEIDNPFELAALRHLNQIAYLSNVHRSKQKELRQKKREKDRVINAEKKALRIPKKKNNIMTSDLEGTPASTLEKPALSIQHGAFATIRTVDPQSSISTKASSEDAIDGIKFLCHEYRYIVHQNTGLAVVPTLPTQTHTPIPTPTKTTTPSTDPVMAEDQYSSTCSTHMATPTPIPNTKTPNLHMSRASECPDSAYQSGVSENTPTPTRTPSPTYPDSRRVNGRGVREVGHNYDIYRDTHTRDEGMVENHSDRTNFIDRSCRKMLNFCNVSTRTQPLFRHTCSQSSIGVPEEESSIGCSDINESATVGHNDSSGDPSTGQDKMDGMKRDSSCHETTSSHTLTSLPAHSHCYCTNIKLPRRIPLSHKSTSTLPCIRNAVDTSMRCADVNETGYVDRRMRNLSTIGQRDKEVKQDEDGCRKDSGVDLTFGTSRTKIDRLENAKTHTQAHVQPQCEEVQNHSLSYIDSPTSTPSSKSVVLSIRTKGKQTKYEQIETPALEDAHLLTYAPPVASKDMIQQNEVKAKPYPRRRLIFDHENESSDTLPSASLVPIPVYTSTNIIPTSTKSTSDITKAYTNIATPRADKTKQSNDIDTQTNIIPQTPKSTAEIIPTSAPTHAPTPLRTLAATRVLTEKEVPNMGREEDRDEREHRHCKRIKLEYVEGSGSGECNRGREFYLQEDDLDTIDAIIKSEFPSPYMNETIRECPDVSSSTPSLAEFYTLNREAAETAIPNKKGGNDDELLIEYMSHWVSATELETIRLNDLVVDNASTDEVPRPIPVSTSTSASKATSTSTLTPITAPTRASARISTRAKTLSSKSTCMLRFRHVSTTSNATPIHTSTKAYSVLNNRAKRKARPKHLTMSKKKSTRKNLTCTFDDARSYLDREGNRERSLSADVGLGAGVNGGKGKRKQKEKLIRWVPRKNDCGIDMVTTNHYVRNAFRDSISRFDLLFDMVAFNPECKGMLTRRYQVSQRDKFLELYKDQFIGSINVSTGAQRIPTIMVEMSNFVQMIASSERDGYCFKKSRKYFPSTYLRQPFATIEEAQDAIREHMPEKIAEGFTLPSLEQFENTLQKGIEHQRWYHSFYSLVFDGCGGDPDELKLFMSLLATSSPNSNVHQNTLSALLNYRAISQDCRPKWGSYPSSNLLNYLAGALGVPSGMKIRCFLDNLANARTSECVTIDTHMQRFLLGNGHLSLSPFHYAILEDYCRTAARLLPIRIQAHEMQASIWCTIAGPFSFKQEISQCRRSHTFQLCSAARTAGLGPQTRGCKDDDTVATIQKILMNSNGHRLAVRILREKLLDIGYMSYLDDANFNGESWATATVTMLVPIRQQHTMGIKGRLDMRKRYAERQNRELRPNEVKEREREERVLERTLGSATGEIDNPGDKEWFDRDMSMVARWLYTEDKHATLIRAATMEAERDPYFKTHLHFAGSAATLTRLLPTGGFSELLYKTGAHLCD